MEYRQERILRGKGSESAAFVHALRGLAVDAGGAVYAVGDSRVEVLGPEGTPLRRWATASPGYAVAVDRGGGVWVGEAGQVEIFDAGGRLADAWRDEERLGLVTAIGFTGDGVLFADARARCLRHYGRRGDFRNNVGDRHRKGGFHIPNGVVDFALDAGGRVHVANPGLHRVERYTPEGELLGHFGRFDGVDPEGFPGCCNPTNVAVRDGRIVVSEKAGPRVKVYDPAGRLLSVVASGEAFDPGAVNMDVAVDPRGRILVADPRRLHIVVFAPVGEVEMAEAGA